MSEVSVCGQANKAPLEAQHVQREAIWNHVADCMDRLTYALHACRFKAKQHHARPSTTRQTLTPGGPVSSCTRARGEHVATGYL